VSSCVPKRRTAAVLGAAAHLAGEPPLALARIVVGQQMRGAGVPPDAEPVAELQSNSGVGGLTLMFPEDW
jgi:hypothetical protein